MMISLEGATPRCETSNVWIAPNAAVIGKVSLANNASVWFGAVLRGDNEPISIGARANIQDLCVLHTDPGFPLTIGEDCSIGHQAMLHGCKVGAGSMIGIGAIVLNGATIGKGCLIGAGAVVTEGAQIPDNSLVVGMPGKVKRPVTPEQAKLIIDNAADYARRAQRYRAAGV
jgi:carbonic anhydrase/acetyltransferase-like protein (isoleucine patch superfamily)